MSCLAIFQPVVAAGSKAPALFSHFQYLYLEEITDAIQTKEQTPLYCVTCCLSGRE